MLHPVPDSTKRRRLLRVVWLQRRLILRLCALPPKSSVDAFWLEESGRACTKEWVTKFWTTDKGHRGEWCQTIAAAPTSAKTAILKIVAEQLRFTELYRDKTSFRISNHDWSKPVPKAVRNLLESFYDPLFYKACGYQAKTESLFHKGHFIAGFTPRVRVCPYTDTIFQDTKLDHFLPKSKFPILSCHPDNLIPCSTDSNSGGHKGAKIPLDLDDPEQAAKWFHPRWRSARNTFRLRFSDAITPRHRIQFKALVAANQARVDTMEEMFGLAEFWGRHLDSDLQLIASEISECLKGENIVPTEASIHAKLTQLAAQRDGGIGRDALAIVHANFYEHILESPPLLKQLVRTCINGI